MRTFGCNIVLAAIGISFLLYFLRKELLNQKITLREFINSPIVANVDVEINRVESPVESEDEVEETTASLKVTVTSPLGAHPKVGAKPSYSSGLPNLQDSYVSYSDNIHCCMLNRSFIFETHLS